MDNFASRVPAGKQPHYWVCGDTNAHTGIAPDSIRLDGHGISSDVQALDQLPADLQARANLCTHKVDVCGKQQLNFCKDNELLILNGGAPGDTSGKVTFVGRGAGTLDRLPHGLCVAGQLHQAAGGAEHGQRGMPCAQITCRCGSAFSCPVQMGTHQQQHSSSHLQSRACQTSDLTRVKQRFGNRTLQQLQSGCGYRMQ